MNESAEPRPTSNRRFLILIAVIVLLTAGLSGGWFWAAGKLEAAYDDFAQRIANQGKHLECAQREARGFPFRIGLHCESFSYADPSGGITVSGNSVRSAAQLYRPGHVVGELDPPYDIALPGLVPLTLGWDNLQSSARVSTESLERFSAVADGLTISANDFGVRDLLGSLSGLQFHARPGPEKPDRDLEVAFSGTQWVIDDNGAGAIEPLDFALQFEMQDGMTLLRQRADFLSHLRGNGGSGDLGRLEVRTESGGRLLASGPLSIDRRGLLSGELTLELDDPQKLVAYGQNVFPPLGEALSQWNQYLQAFASVADGKVKIRDLRITIDKGRMRMGFIDLGAIPPLI